MSVVLVVIAHSTGELRLLQGSEADGAATYIISLAGAVKGRLDEAHLGDHPAAVQALAECMTEGTDLGELMVLERMQVRRHSHTPSTGCWHPHAALCSIQHMLRTYLVLYG